MHIYVMVKRPVAGAVKTRLASTLGSARAANLQRHWIAHILRVLKRTSSRPALDVALAASTQSAVRADCWRRIVGRVRVVAQARGALGTRMWQLLSAHRPGWVAVVAADIPDLRPSHLRGVLGSGLRRTCIVGPSVDGGFWILAHGAKRSGRRLGAGPLNGVSWSRGDTLTQTLTALRRAGISVHCGFQLLRDIDAVEDLATVPSASASPAGSGVCKEAIQKRTVDLAQGREIVE